MTRHIDLLRSREKAAAGKLPEAPAVPAKKGRKKKKDAAAPVPEEFAMLHDETTDLDAAPPELPEEMAALPEEPATPVAARKSMATSAATNGADAIRDILAHIIDSTLTAFRHAATDTNFDFSALQQATDEIVSRLEAEPAQLNQFELVLTDREKYLLNMDPNVGDLLQKAMTMMLYALKIGLQLSLPQHSLVDLALAATLHHLGMARISTQVRHKKNKLSEDELAMIGKAPEFSAAYLQRNGLNRGDILLAVANAQERHDGSGPRGLEGNSIPPLARIVGLLSMFESLIHVRSYRERLLPRDAIRLLIKNHKKSFDPAILKALIDAISLYPVGCFVQLNTGEVGQVVSVNPRLPLRPKVEIRFNRQGDEIPAREVDLRNQPTLMVRRCMYEESARNLSE